MGKKTEYKNVRYASNSSIEITFYYPTQAPEDRQRERVELQPTPANLERAFRHLGDINDSIKAGTFDYAATFPNSPRAKQFQNRRLLQTYMRYWLDEHKFDYDDSTYVTYSRIIENQLKGLARLRMEAMTWGDITAWVRKQKITQKTANNKLSPIRKAFAWANDEGDVHNNPFANRKSPAVKKHEREEVDEEGDDDVDPFSRDEIAAMLGKARYKQDKNLVQFDMGSGLRISELIALSWPQIDFIKRTARIIKKRTVHSKKAGKPKTKASKRTIKLNAWAWEALMNQKQYTFLEGKEIFINPRTSQPYTGDGQLRAGFWAWLLKRSGVRYRGPGQMRHTWASTALQCGENPYGVSANLGHTDPSFTMRVYNSYIPDNHPDFGEKFERFFHAEEMIKAGKKLAE
jgi:integrase